MEKKENKFVRCTDVNKKNEYIYVIITKLTMFEIVETETKYIIQLEESNKKTLNVFNDTGN